MSSWCIYRHFQCVWARIRSLLKDHVAIAECVSFVSWNIVTLQQHALRKCWHERTTHPTPELFSARQVTHDTEEECRNASGGVVCGRLSFELGRNNKRTTSSNSNGIVMHGVHPKRLKNARSNSRSSSR